MGKRFRLLFFLFKGRPPLADVVVRQINVVNESTVVSASELSSVVATLQQQVSQQFAPIWGIDCGLLISQDTSQSLNPSVESLYVLDDTDQAEALGYHELAGNNDVPVGFVFAKTCLDYNTPWSSCLSHELLEQLVDPWVYSTAIAQWAGKPAVVFLEVCDPVESDEYTLNGVALSNFVTPAWFQPQPPASSPFDFLKKLTGPLSLSAGGYASVSYTLKTWKQVTADARLIRRYRADPNIAHYSRKGGRRQR